MCNACSLGSKPIAIMGGDEGFTDTRLKKGKALIQRFTTLSTEVTDRTSFKGPDWDFVLKEDWSGELDGPFDHAKVGRSTLRR